MNLLTTVFITLCACLTSEAARIVRFLSDDGLIHFGDAILPSNTTDSAFATTAKLIEGDILNNFTITEQVMVGSLKTAVAFALSLINPIRQPINTLLSPLPNDAVRTVRCVGINYADHANEVSRPIPHPPQ